MKKNKLSLRETVVLGLLTAILFATQVGMAVLPNINLVSVLILIYTLTYGKKVFLIIYGFAILEGLVYGFGIWWVMYLYVWSILALIVMLLKNNRSIIVWAAVTGGFGLCFGFLCAIPYFLAGGPAAGFGYWLTGIPFDIIHCASNVALTLIVFRPLMKIMAVLEPNVKLNY